MTEEQYKRLTVDHLRLKNAMQSLIGYFEGRVGEGEDGSGRLPIKDIVNSHKTNLRPVELSTRQMQLILFCLDRAMGSLPD